MALCKYLFPPKGGLKRSRMMDSAFDYDLRQYKLMWELLTAFERGSINLRKLIEDLRSLLEALERPNPSWEKEFRADWWTLEQVYAAAIDRGACDPLPEGSQALVVEAILSLKDLILKAIDSSQEGAER
jgi:hypothetical protein